MSQKDSLFPNSFTFTVRDQAAHKTIAAAEYVHGGVTEVSDTM